jgi:hypothetical protein
MWVAFGAEQRQRFQQLLVPTGLTWVDGDFGTSVSPQIFNLLPLKMGDESKLVRPLGLEPKTR